MNTSKSMKISVCVLAVLFFFGYGNIARAQSGSGKVTTTTKPKIKPKTSKTVPKSTKTVTTKTRKTPDPPLAEWEMNNMFGHWEGVFQGRTATLEIENIEGSTFYGTMESEGYKIAFTGFVDKTNRKVTMTETKVLSQPSNGSWTLGINSGALKYAALEMNGTGKDGENPSYKWSFVKIID
jgi:hypothetical protein